MKTKPYFTIPVTARSPEELEMRIKDNESRGFELVKTGRKDNIVDVWRDGGYRNAAGAVYRHGGLDVHTSYTAVMKRDNAKFLEEKKRREEENERSKIR